ncbi:MAG: DNA cytosine methyltransferase, partial [Alphaproteobacteria bacterium]|nr:DNA cytosine methyltransferase [Alphaproteobacteria bacterium]
DALPIYYLAGRCGKDELQKKYPEEWKRAESSAVMMELGEHNHDNVRKLIAQRIGEEKKWVLVGGPPCQAYSLVGRSRRINDPKFEEDEKHFLYKEYLQIIIDHKPPVFVMENVKGLLSAKVEGELVVKKILEDLANPIKAISKKDNGLKYRLYSLSAGTSEEEIDPKSFVVKAEEYGVPQARHRMFVVGVRSDFQIKPCLLKKKSPPNVQDVIGDLPSIRSGISKQPDSLERWRKTVASKTTWATLRRAKKWKKIVKVIDETVQDILNGPDAISSTHVTTPSAMQQWFADKGLKALTGHEARAHMKSDILRYMFASCYAKANGSSPQLSDFPKRLLPSHKNVEEGCNGDMFSDRFRVQLGDRVSTTVTSHISKDGHYFIHYDPLQCRSLTVREAARLQTFPDNYHFEGPRTAQFHQVGNAVPPYLAKQIAKIIQELLDKIPEE